MPFHDEGVEEGYEVVNQLLSAIKSKGLLQRKVSIKSWNEEFKKLRVHVPGHKIETVLEWYCANIGKDFVPVALSAKAFRTKFAQIELAMQRSLKDKDSPSTELGQKVLQRLRNLRWSGADPEDLAQAVEKSLSAYVPFYQRCKKYFRDTMAPSLNHGPVMSSDRLFNRLYWTVFRAPEDFIESWFHSRHLALVTWAAWNGSFAGEIFHLQHQRFKFLVRKEALEYGSTEKNVKELMEKLT